MGLVGQALVGRVDAGFAEQSSVDRPAELRSSHILRATFEPHVWNVFFSTWAGERRSSCQHLRDDSLLVLPRFANESCIKVAITVRGGVLKFTLVIDHDTTLHGVHADTVVFSPTVLIKCSICSYPLSLMRRVVKITMKEES